MFPLAHELRDRLFHLWFIFTGVPGVRDEQLKAFPHDVFMAAVNLAVARLDAKATGEDRPFLRAIASFFSAGADWLKTPAGQQFLGELAVILLHVLAGL